MKVLVLLLKIVMGALALVFLVRLALLFFRALHEAIGYNDFVAYDPTVFLLVGLFLLPPTLAILKYLRSYLRRRRQQ
jgi:hypothetical protein